MYTILKQQMNFLINDVATIFPSITSYYVKIIRKALFNK